MSQTIPIDIAVCTYQRPHIAETLRSLAQLELPPGYDIRIIVADNDTIPSAQVLVKATADEHNLNVTYLHAASKNIAIARNACLEAATADYFAFIDDDEIVSPQWLHEMLTTLHDSNADIILGPVHALYPESAPSWLKSGAIHSTKPVYVKGKITTGYAGNVLMRRSIPALKHVRFREELGVTGGEDTMFFSALYVAGAQIAYAEAAHVYEFVPPERLRWRWLTQRWLRYGETYAASLIEANRNRYIHSIKSLLKMGLLCVAAPFTILHPYNSRRYLLRAVMHAAVIRTLLSNRHVHAA